MKKTITSKNLALAAFLAATFLTNAQEQPKMFGKVPLIANENGFISCATVENELNLKQLNAKRANENQFESWIAGKIEEARAERLANPKSGNAVKIIPVVVHVIHNGDAVGANENISLERIESQIAVLNEDYGQVDGSNGGPFYEFGVNTGIQFCLAKIKEDGTPTDGADRINNQVAQYTTRQSVEDVKSFTIWDPEKYLNIWTINWGGELSNLLGYAQFPSNSTLQGLDSNGGEEYTDGVAISWKSFGSKEKLNNQGTFNDTYNYGRTTTHEIGHFLGLRHIWGDETACQGNDYCADTPVQRDKSSGCPNPSTDTCPAPGLDMWQNYMDYTNDICMSAFTANQKTRMETVLANSVRRKKLLTSTVCGTLGTVDFKMLQGINVYPNPAQTVINIATETELPDSYTVFNSLGQIVVSAQNVSDANTAINISGFANGIYFLKVDKGSESKTIKFIKN